MESSEVIDRKRVGVGYSQARYVEFPDGTVGIWKPKTVTMGGTERATQNSEIAAFRVDRHLGFNRVPITISKKLNGQDGSVQLLVDNLGEYDPTQAKEELALFDYLIHNGDRHSENLLYSTKGFVAAIDHGFAFDST